MTGQRVLVVDDEPVVAEVVQRYLELDGFNVALAADGRAALDTASAWTPDLVVLDLMLPRVDGLEVCRRLRESGPVPIVMLTARGDEADRIVGLELGADDYVVKPFSPRELVARVRSVLRRSGTAARAGSGETLRVGDLLINPQGRVASRNGAALNLTAKEFDLLQFLAGHLGEVFTRQELMDHVWDYTFAGDASTVTVHVRRLREKVEPDPVKPRYIKTVWGVGYKMEAAA